MVQVHIKGQDGKSKLWNRPTDTSFTRGEFYPYGNYLERQRVTFNPSGIYTFHYKQIAERPPPPEDTTLENAIQELEILIDEFNDLNASNVSETEMNDWWNRESFIYENRWQEHLNNKYISGELNTINIAVDNYIHRLDKPRDPLPKPKIPKTYDPSDEPPEDHDPELLTPAEVYYAERVGLTPRINQLERDYNYIYGRLQENPDNAALNQRYSEITRELKYLYIFTVQDDKVRQLENRIARDIEALPERNWNSIMAFLEDFKKDIIIPTMQVLDDLGIIRTATFFTGAYLAHKFADPIIEKVFKTQVPKSTQQSQYQTRTWIKDKAMWSEWQIHESLRTIDPTTVHNAFSQALGWSSRWTIGVPMYELTQQQLYPEQALIRSTPQEPIYWKEEFWGMFKKHGVTYWNLRNQGYNYKANTLTLRAYLEKRGEKLLPIGKYSIYH